MIQITRERIHDAIVLHHRHGVALHVLIGHQSAADPLAVSARLRQQILIVQRAFERRRRLPSRPFSTCPVREGMTRRQRENLELGFWIGVISVELSLFATL